MGFVDFLAKQVTGLVASLVTFACAIFFSFIYIFTLFDPTLQDRLGAVWPFMLWSSAVWVTVATALVAWIAYPGGGFSSRAGKGLAVLLWLITIVSGVVVFLGALNF